MRKTSDQVRKNFLLWAELVDLGEASALEMIKKTKPNSNALDEFKRALEYQSAAHHQANIQVLKRLSK